jgi:hypothetical protein
LVDTLRAFSGHQRALQVDTRTQLKRHDGTTEPLRVQPAASPVNENRKDHPATRAVLACRGRSPDACSRSSSDAVTAQGNPQKYATWLRSRTTWERDAFANLTATFCRAAASLPQPAPGFRFHLAHLSDASLLHGIIREAKAAGALAGCAPQGHAWRG